MERLSDNAIDIINQLHTTERLDYISDYISLINAANRLAAYEDTGLEPDEVADLAHGETERNAPLTLDELSKMDGEPVWVVLEEDDTPVKGYGIVDNDLECISGLKFRLQFEDYGVRLAYRRKLEDRQ